MKRLLISLVVATFAMTLGAQTPKNVEYVYTDARELNLIGKILDGTPNPYHRVDTVKYKGFTKTENMQVRMPAGLAVLFKTNSTSISVLAEYGFVGDLSSTMGIAARGYDLYIKKDGKWLYAASKALSVRRCKAGEALELIKDMDGSEKECMLYLPIHSEITSLKIGVDKDTSLETLESPFRHRIGIFGSSFTHGISTSRPGMSYPMQLMRSTGLQFLSIACSGNCKMQPYYADVLCDADVDALVFDSFSNPDAKMINERLFPFIEKLQAAHPDIPIIFQQTIYRESRNFRVQNEKREKAKQEMAAKLMKEAVKKYKNVYFIQTNATDKNHETSVDGTHPNDYGYTLWAESIEKPLLKILKKYGIR